METEKKTTIQKYEPAKPVKSPNGLKSLIEMIGPKIAEVLPRHVKPTMLLKAALTAAIRNPKLYKCTQESWIEALMRAAQLGLDPSGVLGSGY